jgi:hypothetical protein
MNHKQRVRGPVLAARPAALVVLAGLAAAGCGSGTGSTGGGVDAATTDVSFRQDVAPIFANKCTICHWPGNATGLDLTAPFDPDHGLVGRPTSFTDSASEYLVDPGNVANSSLITKVSDPSLPSEEEGKAMPWQVPRLTTAELDAIRQWIADGAKDDSFFEDQVAPIFGTEVTLGSQAGKCTWCHAPDGPDGMSVTDVFNELTGLVNADSRYGGKLVVPGDVADSTLIEKLAGDTRPGSQMPYHPAPLTDAEIDRLTRWVAAGAPQN